VNAVSKAARVVAHPARTAGSVAGRTVGLTLGAAKVGVRTTARVVGWAVERAGGPTPQHPSSTFTSTSPSTSVTVPPAPEPPQDEPTVTKAPAQEAPAKVPASEVPLKSAPTPSLPPALEAFDEADDVPAPAPAKKAAAKKAPARKAPAKKAPAKKTTAKKAPSKQAAVLAPALGLSEDEVVEVVEAVEGDADKG
jgi:hypothetical protein